ncbi:Fasciclin domain-domain-containing protein [Aspergillus taichungensis]|uniref:Fasciclin domain-domain-containing protein n=1 Tax=Aspergillus taichungensis TaxID=482145 RepID=A0A2J5I6F1_9EURO|nr:Fasciclin domain-domain-containing protein [Aspergillus taichungensis]
MKLSPWPTLALLPLARGIVLPQQFPHFPPKQEPNQNPNPLDIALDAELASDTSPLQHNWLSNLIDADTETNPPDLPTSHPQSLSQIPSFRSSPPPHHPPATNKTLYQLITECKHTTILARIVSKDEELTRLLNASDANITLFAPPDSAFKSGGESDHEEENFVAKYHLLDGLYPAVRIFHAQTLPTLLVGDDQNLGDDLPQRVAVRVGWRGIVINQYSRIVVSDIKATNGLLHSPTHILTPPKPTKKLIDENPSHFSTLALALHKTNLSLSTHSNTHPQSQSHKKRKTTTLAPTNAAFSKLGSKTTSFLFSPSGLPYLRRLLQYHLVPDRAIYTDVVYGANGSVTEIPAGVFTHLDVPTEDEDEEDREDGNGGAHLGIDVMRFGAYASVKVNGYTRVVGRDVVVSDGVVQVVGHVLVPPLRVVDDSGGWGREVAPEWTGEEDEITVEDLKRRLGGERELDGFHGEL